MIYRNRITGQEIDVTSEMHGVWEPVQLKQAARADGQSASDAAPAKAKAAPQKKPAAKKPAARKR